VFVDTITIGLARVGDAPGIAAMSRVLVESGLPWSWTPRRVAAHVRDRENLAVTARSGRSLVGFGLAQFGDATVHLSLLAVATAYQRNGLGRRLVHWIEESAVVAGLFVVKLEVRAGNQQARRFYASLGYRQSGTVPGYYSGIEDAIRFSRNLSVAEHD